LTAEQLAISLKYTSIANLLSSLRRVSKLSELLTLKKKKFSLRKILFALLKTKSNPNNKIKTLRNFLYF